MSSQHTHHYRPTYFKDMVLDAAKESAARTNPKPEKSIAKRLTPRERQVLAHMLVGMSCKETVRVFRGTNCVTGGDVTFRSVEHYRSNIQHKLGVSTTAEVVAMVILEIVGQEKLQEYIAALLAPPTSP